MVHLLIQEKGCKQGAMAKIQESESYHEKKNPLPTLGGLILNIKKRSEPTHTQSQLE